MFAKREGFFRDVDDVKAFDRGTDTDLSINAERGRLLREDAELKGPDSRSETEPFVLNDRARSLKGSGDFEEPGREGGANPPKVVGDVWLLKAGDGFDRGCGTGLLALIVCARLVRREELKGFVCDTGTDALPAPGNDALEELLL